MASTDLHALPAGSIITDSELEAVAMRCEGVATRPWLVVSPNSNGAWFNVGLLLGMSDDWTVLRRGPAVADEHTGPDPEVRHYIAEVGEMRAHMTLTGNDDGGRIVTDRHPWEPLYSKTEDVTWYRVSAAVADQYDSDDDEDEDEDRPEIDPVDLDSP